MKNANPPRQPNPAQLDAPEAKVQITDLWLSKPFIKT